jgi:predicted DNA-binding transcriptional regulator YafY
MSRVDFHDQQPGSYGNVQFAFAFVAWMQSRRTPPSARDLRLRFGMGRATAYRYLQRYRDAFGGA